jgi:hypothetical protein
MTEAGEAFVSIVQLSASSFTEFFAPSGETRKISMAYAKAPSQSGSPGVPTNAKFSIAPSNGTETTPTQGVDASKRDVQVRPPLGTNADMITDTDSIEGLHPLFITDSNGVFLGNNDSSPVDVILQGVRIS